MLEPNHKLQRKHFLYIRSTSCLYRGNRTDLNYAYKAYYTPRQGGHNKSTDKNITSPEIEERNI